MMRNFEMTTEGMILVDADYEIRVVLMGAALRTEDGTPCTVAMWHERGVIAQLQTPYLLSCGCVTHILLGPGQFRLDS